MQPVSFRPFEPSRPPAPIEPHNMSIDLGPLGQQNALSAMLVLIGATYLSYVVYIVGRVLLSTFVLPGQSVSFLKINMQQNDLLTRECSSPHLDPKAPGQS